MAIFSEVTEKECVKVRSCCVLLLKEMYLSPNNFYNFPAIGLYCSNDVCDTFVAQIQVVYDTDPEAGGWRFSNEIVGLVY